jgi:Asp-tRNA(Asn)/Glu-tRNA(Gln) amidotransferase A subunit family amidase
MPAPLNEWTACEIAAAVNAGKVTCEAVTRACLDRIATREPEVQAWSHCNPDQAITAARELDRRGAKGPIAGVPFGVKDIIDSEDMPTEWGTPIHRGRQPERDAACVALSRKAGGLLLGKAVTTEFANLHAGPTRNPHDLTRTPGGSSSGSAAAVADFMVPIAIGTQTTGSTTRPASFCGIIGYRPTWGDMRLHGVMEASGSVDTLGILARSVDDVALYRNVLLGVPPAAVEKPTRPLRIGFCRTHNWDQLERSTQKSLENAAQTLARAGAEVRDMEMPPEFSGLNAAHRTITGFEFVRTFTWEIEHHWNEISETLRGGRLADGLSCSLETYYEAKALGERCRADADTVLADYDVLLTASAFGEAPVGTFAFTGVPVFQMWTMLHVPSITLPVFKGPNGMPVGAQLVARRRGDRGLFAAARWVQERLTK